MLYYIIILSAMVIISVLDIIFAMPVFNLSVGYIILAVVISTIVEILISGLIAFIIRWILPRKWFTIDKKIYTASKGEVKFYDKINIKKWKEKVLELGCFTSFHKTKVAKPNDNEFIGRFIVESNYGVLIHFVSIFLGFLVIFIYPLKFFYLFGLPVSLVGAFLNLLPTFILRYNLVKLHKIYNFNAKKEQKLDSENIEFKVA